MHRFKNEMLLRIIPDIFINKKQQNKYTKRRQFINIWYRVILHPGLL